MALQVKDATNTTQNLAVTTNGDGSFTGQTIIQDPVTQTNLAAVLAPADVLSQAGKFGLVINSFAYLFNGSTWDRMRPAAGTGGASAATAVLAVNTEGNKATYSFGANIATVAATPTDVVTLSGSASKTVRILRVTVSAIGVAASTDLALVKRTAANTGGTASTPTPAQHDSSDAAATAVLSQYSANAASLGTGINFRTQKLNLNTAGSAGSLTWDFTSRNGKGMVLRGTTQFLAISFLNAPTAPTSLNYDVEWTEE